jgi:RNA-binding protein 26
MMQPNIPLDMPFMPPFPFPPFSFLPPQQSGPPPPPNDAFIGSNKAPADRNGSTLLVLNIPGQHLSTPSITTYFQTFGSVKSVALDRPGNRALVEFESNHQAFKAWKSDDPVWGSRNVRVLWHRPRPGQGGLGLSVLEKNQGLVEKIKMDNAPGAAEERLRAQVKEIEEREKRGKKERLMAEQKVLLKRAKEGSRDEKKVLLVRLREVMTELSDLDKVVEDSGDVHMGGAGDDEDDKRRLHRELEKHGMETVESAEQKELMRLSAQLSELKEKVCSESWSR